MSEIHETTPLLGVPVVEKSPPFTSSRNDKNTNENDDDHDDHDHDDTAAAVVIVVQTTPTTATTTTTTTTTGTMMSPFDYGKNEASNYLDYRLVQVFQNIRNLIFMVIGCAILYFMVEFGVRHNRIIVSFPSFGTTTPTPIS